MNVVTSTTHSKVFVHLHFRKCSSILWVMVANFCDMATNPWCLVGKTNFVGCCINKILNTLVIVIWTNITPPDCNMLMISNNFKLSPWMPFFIQNAYHKCCDMMIGHLLPLPARWAKHGWPCAHNYELSKLPCFCDDGFNMIWDSRYYCWVELNAYEQECAMEFHTHAL
jgi:hypothetical protein